MIDFALRSTFWISVDNCPTVFSGLSVNIPDLVGSGRTTLGGIDLDISTAAMLEALRNIVDNILLKNAEERASASKAPDSSGRRT